MITGANRGIGKTLVEGQLVSGAAKVYAAVRSLESTKNLVEEHGKKVVPIQLDLSQPETIISAAKVVSDVQIVINNAGVLKSSNPFAQDAIESLKFEMEVNVFGLIRMAQSFAPILKESEYCCPSFYNLLGGSNFPDFLSKFNSLG